PRILAHLNRLAPHLEVRSTSVHWADLKLEMIAGRIDLAIELSRLTDPQLQQQLLLQDSFCVMAGPGFHGELTAERYLASEHVAVTSRRRGICVEDLALGHLGVRRRIGQHCQHFLTAAQLVAQGDGLLTLTRNNARLINAGLHNQI
ncbi:LysR family transcriptional regulator, partial [Pseudomonas sp. Fl4BN2]|nr:LysR family transcriptional regulator [Pseudomonas sp. Fl4BN2]